MGNKKETQETRSVRLHDQTVEYALVGDKGPVTVLECGLGDTLKVWKPLIEKSSGNTRFFLYNRAGYGKSKSLNSARDGRNIAMELHSLLHQLQLKPPYILVGHSLGCCYVKIFADLYRDEVRGLLLLDPMTEEMDELCQTSKIKEWELSIYKKIMLALFLSKGAKKELDKRESSLRQARQCDFSLKAFPVSVVTADRAMWSTPIQQQWLRSHQFLVQRISGCTHIIAENTGHHVQKERPQLIADLLEKMVTTGAFNKEPGSNR